MLKPDYAVLAKYMRVLTSCVFLAQHYRKIKLLILFITLFLPAILLAPRPYHHRFYERGVKLWQASQLTFA